MRERVINAAYKEGAHLTVRGVWQHDHGVKLRLTGMENAQRAMVHFAPAGYGLSADADCVQEDGAWTCGIPDAALDKPVPVMAYVYATTQQDGWMRCTMTLLLELEPRKGITQ